jgi:hypothetical protein
MNVPLLRLEGALPSPVTAWASSWRCEVAVKLSVLLHKLTRPVQRRLQTFGKAITIIGDSRHDRACIAWLHLRCHGWVGGMSGERKLSANSKSHALGCDCRSIGNCTCTGFQLNAIHPYHLYPFALLTAAINSPFPYYDDSFPAASAIAASLALAKLLFSPCLPFYEAAAVRFMLNCFRINIFSPPISRNEGPSLRDVRLRGVCLL